MSDLVHLVKRFLLTLDRRQVAEPTLESVRSILLIPEFELWSQMSLDDKKHSITVMRRFLERQPTAEITAVRASLLHDIGKMKSNLGVLGRVVATIIGSRGKRFSQYHNHQSIGAHLLRHVGSDETTCQLVGGTVNDDQIDLLQIAEALQAADDL